MIEEIRRSETRQFVDALWAHERELVDAIVADGWPESMVQAGLKMHRQSWDVDALAESLKTELRGVAESRHHRLVWPTWVHHIWPALPGAGVGPVLVAMLLGIPQRVRPSRRGMAFARYFADLAGLELIEPGEDYNDADLVVVSGHDDTVEAVRRAKKPGGRVVGYGHRVSLALVIDDPSGSVALSTIARKIASDVVMWHQQGCFSVRAVLFCGSHERRRHFCRHLAEQIAEREKVWAADDPGDAELAARAQALGVAEMRGEVWCQGVGYVRAADTPFDGEHEAIHSVTVHSVDDAGALAQAVDVAPDQLQGVAIAGAWRRHRQRWIAALARLGATRVAPAGALQSPPATWWHDGQPNALSWARMVTFDDELLDSDS